MKTPETTSQASTDYEPRRFWSDVASEIGRRGAGGCLAGDDTPFFAYKRQRFLTQFLQSLPARGNAVLEVGCGPGGNVAEVAKASPRRLAGADISPTMIELARQNTRHLSGVDLVLVDGKTLPFADREFDVVFTVTVLQHNHEPLWSAGIAEICRVAGEWIYLFEDTAAARKSSYSLDLRPVADYVAQCVTHGFELVSQEPLGIYVSDRLTAGVRKFLTARGRPAGEPLPRAAHAVERLTLSITKALDPLVPQRRGLTRMVFRRRRGDYASVS